MSEKHKPPVYLPELFQITLVDLSKALWSAGLANEAASLQKLGSKRLHVAKMRLEAVESRMLASMKSWKARSMELQESAGPNFWTERYTEMSKRYEQAREVVLLFHEAVLMLEVPDVKNEIRQNLHYTKKAADKLREWGDGIIVHVPKKPAWTHA